MKLKSCPHCGAILKPPSFRNPEQVLQRLLRYNSHTQHENWILHEVKSKGWVRLYWWHKPDGKPPLFYKNGKPWYGTLIGKFPDKPFIVVYNERKTE